MQKPAYSPDKRARLLDIRIDELRQRLRSYDPERLAGATKAVFVRGDAGLEDDFRTTLWDFGVRLSCPEFHLYDLSSGEELSNALQALVLYYFLTADGAPHGDAWISFTDLPDGRFYTQAFQGYTGDELQREFGDDQQAFERSALALAGEKVNLGNTAYSFQLLPMAHLLAVCWLGDEDFPTRYQILFNSNISHYLPTDACAIAGSMLTHRLIIAHV